jgi:hypothetical protein
LLAILSCTCMAAEIAAAAPRSNPVSWRSDLTEIESSVQSWRLCFRCPGRTMGACILTFGAISSLVFVLYSYFNFFKKFSFSCSRILR